MDVVQLQMQFLNLVRGLLIQGILEDQFKVIHNQLGLDSPSFTIDLLTQYLSNFDIAVANLCKASESAVVDFDQLSLYIHQIKGSSSWIGIRNVTNICDEFHGYCEEKKREGSLICLQHLKKEHAVAKEYLQKILKLEVDIYSAGGKIPRLN